MESSNTDPCLFTQKNPPADLLFRQRIWEYITNMFQFHSSLYIFTPFGFLVKHLPSSASLVAGQGSAADVWLVLGNYGFKPIRLNFSALTGLKHWSSCWFILPMGRLYKLRVWLQQAPSWVCFEKLQGSSLTEGEKNEVYLKKLVY